VSSPRGAESNLANISEAVSALASVGVLFCVLPPHARRVVVVSQPVHVRNRRSPPTHARILGR